MNSAVMKILLDSSFCVLCTCKNDIPNSSLMLFVCDDHCKKIHMLTLKDSTKHLNILNNTNVSLLIDTRETMQDRTAQVKALTIHGEASIVDDNDTSRKLIDQIVKKHDKVLNLALNSSVCVIEVLIKRILLLESADKGCDVSLPGK